MSKESVNGCNKEQAAYWRKRLNWYLNEATCEEYDEEQVQAIMDLLEILDPEGSKMDYYTPEKGLERFHQTLEIRERIRNEFDRLQAGEVSLAECEACEKEKKGKKRYRTKRFTKLVTAAALVAAMFLGGTIGIYAERDGMFRKVNTGEDKNTIVSSVETIGIGSKAYKIYEKLEDVPVKYLSCLWTPSGVPDNLDVYKVELTEEKLTVSVRCEFADEKAKEYVNTTKMCFKEKVIMNDRLFDDFDFYCKEKYDSVEVEYLIKKNEDYTEYIARFEHGDCVYYLSSNCDFFTIANMIKQSISSDNL